jgi:integrase
MTRRAGSLTREAVKRLQAGDQITDAGITATRLADGDIRWKIGVMVSGRRIHRVIGRESEGASRAMCEAYIQQVRTEERQDRLQLPTGRKTWLTFAQAAQRYLTRMEEGGGLNLVAKKQHLKMWLIPHFGPKRADAISEAEVNVYKQQRLKAGAARGTVNRELASLKHMLRDAAKTKDIKAVPCTFAMLSEPFGRTKVLSRAEADALVAAAVGDQDPDVWLFVEFGLNTAMRHSEILRARFDEIDWARARLHIGEAKAGGRTQPLTAALVETLIKERLQRADQSGFIFPPRGPDRHGRGYRQAMAEPFRRSVVRAGLDPKEVTPHVMRHTAITRMAEANYNSHTIQQVSGHKTITVLSRYIHIADAQIDAAIAVLQRTSGEPAGSDENALATQATQELHILAEAVGT